MDNLKFMINTNKILIIDDSEANLEYLKRLLDDQNYKVAVARNGQSAIAKVRSQHFDLILLDFVMPDMNGLEVCSELKKDPSCIDTPIIFLTANQSQDLLIEAFNAGAVDFIKKPFNAPELLVRVKTHLSLVESRKQLALAKDYAESASKAKGEFLANMSHEIRTPMNGIISVIEFLEETNLNAKQLELTGIIKTSSENLLGIINDILDFSKIEAGQIELEHINFNLKKELESVIKPLSLKALEKGLIVKLSVDSDIPEIINGDVLRFTQIVINLLNNAIKFTGSGGIFITAKKIINNQKPFVKLEIKDTGIGISSSNIQKLFKSFSQTDASSTRKYGGTGLGLAISKNLVEIMGGEINVESIKNQGSTFWFTIPLIAPTIHDIDQIKEANENISSIECRKILIVDDNAINRKVAEMTLGKLGHNTETAINGIEAYHKFLNEDFDVILMDVQMPEMDGLETTTLIRKYERDHELKKSIPIIAMTAAAMKGDKERFLDSGMNEYISKPFKIKDIKIVLRKLFG